MVILYFGFGSSIFFIRFLHSLVSGIYFGNSNLFYRILLYVWSTVSASNGGFPITKAYKIIPTAQISTS